MFRLPKKSNRRWKPQYKGEVHPYVVIGVSLVVAALGLWLAIWGLSLPGKWLAAGIGFLGTLLVMKGFSFAAMSVPGNDEFQEE